MEIFPKEFTPKSATESIFSLKNLKKNSLLNRNHKNDPDNLDSKAESKYSCQFENPRYEIRNFIRIRSRHTFSRFLVFTILINFTCSHCLYLDPECELPLIDEKKAYLGGHVGDASIIPGLCYK